MVSMFVFASFKGDKSENHNINSLVDIMDVLLLEDGSNQVRKFFRGGRWKPKVNHLSRTAEGKKSFHQNGYRKTSYDLQTFTEN